MTMHLVRGMSSLNVGKPRKRKNKSASLRQAETDMEKFYARLGVDTSKKSTFRYEIPVYTTETKIRTSDRIPTHVSRKETPKYSGERTLLGVATMHKSNMVPVFADRKDDAKDIANMRRN